MGDKEKWIGGWYTIDIKERNKESFDTVAAKITQWENHNGSFLVGAHCANEIGNSNGIELR